jgi:membrane-associated HD superfamily phosphohydrolase
MEPIGSITLTLSVVAVFLLVLGLPLVKRLNNRTNLKRHGILTLVALALQTVLIFVIMVPSLIQNFGKVVPLQPVFSSNTWFHAVLGLSAFISGFAYVALWLFFYSSGMRCARAKKST